MVVIHRDFSFDGIGVRDPAITGLTMAVRGKHLHSVFPDTSPRRTATKDQGKKVPQDGTQKTVIPLREDYPAPGV